MISIPFPRYNRKESSYVIDRDFLKKINIEIESDGGYFLHLDEIEAVLLALEKMSTSEKKETTK